MQRTKTRIKKENKSYLVEMLKALIIALIISLVLVLLMALFIKLFNIPTSAINIINQVIRSVSVLTAALLAFKLPKNGWLRGLIFGVLYVLLSFLVFSLLAAEFKVGLSLLNDTALGAVSGLISGIIAVNLRRRRGSGQ